MKVVYRWTQEHARRATESRSTNILAATRHAVLPADKPLSAHELDRLSERIEAWLIEWLQARASIPTEQIHRDRPFAEYGLDSLTAVELSQQLEDWLGVELTPVIAWNYPTPAKLAPYLAAQSAGRDAEPSEAVLQSTDASSVDDFERLLAEIESLDESEVETALFQKR